MFQFVGLATSLGWHASCVSGFPIRTSADQGPFAPPRGFSQPAASFFASGSQGIPRAPFGTCRVPRQSRRPLGLGTPSILALYSILPEFLSFLPSCQRTPPCHKGREEVVPGRLELPTPTLSVWCSNRLSYGTPSSRGRPLPGASLKPDAASTIRNLFSFRYRSACPPERRCSSRTFRYGYLVTT